MKISRLFVAMLCIATLGLTSSCSKDDSKGNSAAIVGKWKCTYAWVESVRYDENGNIEREDEHEDAEEIGKVWEFTSDGHFLREGSQRLNYSINGNEIIFTASGESGSMSLMIKELNGEFMTLVYAFDDRSSSGEGYYMKETYEFRKM